MYTSGAIILTNDGDFVYKITHPKYEIEKTYIVTIKGKITYDEMNKLKNGVEIDDYISSNAKVKLIKYNEEKNISRVCVTIHEGKNREVRKMFKVLEKSVIALHRSKIGFLDVKDLPIGSYRHLKLSEINMLLDKNELI